MLSLLMVCLVLNCDPAFPPDGSGLLGFVLEADFLNEEPPLVEAALAAMNFLLLAFLPSFRFDCVYFGINKKFDFNFTKFCVF